MKQSKIREMVPLLAPVLIIAVWGLWLSRQPKPTVAPATSTAAPVGAVGAVGAAPPATGGIGLVAAPLPKKRIVPPAVDEMTLRFYVERPTILQAFDGYDAIFVVEGWRKNGSPGGLDVALPFFDLQTAQGTRRIKKDPTGVWSEAHQSGTYQTRIPVRMRRLPPGELIFGADVRAIYPTGYAPLHGRWRVNRAAIRPRDFMALPRPSQISLVEVKINGLFSGTKGAGASRISGVMGFQIDSKNVNLQTPMEFRLAGAGAAIDAPGVRDSWIKPRKTPRRRITEWTLDVRSSPPSAVVMTGRISANKSWPLGFQIEPLDPKTVKVGQKLKFKQFPVPLPK